MGFFDDKLGPIRKAEPTPVAPGGWWQTPTQQQQAQPQAVDRGQGPSSLQPGQHAYAPVSSGLVKNRLQQDVADNCPRCNSFDYIKIAAEPAAGSTYALPGASMRCMVCNYPGIDTSEGVLGGPAGFISSGGSVEANTLRVRERGGKNCNSFSGFNESSQAEGSTVVRIM
jgi:hypothetical protein